MKNIISAAAVLAVAVSAAVFAAESKPAAADREFTSVNIEYKGSKVWTPGVFIVKKGEKVKITLINNAPSGVHAFAIDGYEGAQAAVDNKPGANTKTIAFTADKAGLFRIFCPMHAPHVGGQLLVLE
jgi:nitrosocyanin